MKDFNRRTYLEADCAVFRKTSAPNGALSNMAGGFPLRIDDTDIRTNEALYQACRYPKRPDIQAAIILEASPMAAKMVAKRYIAETRPDWDNARVPIMRWAIHVKLIQHFTRFADVLLATGDHPIVESSAKDDFWGAIPDGRGYLQGRNVLGRLFDEMRYLVVQESTDLLECHPPVDGMQLLGQPIPILRLI